MIRNFKMTSKHIMLTKLSTCDIKTDIVNNRIETL